MEIGREFEQYGCEFECDIIQFSHKFVQYKVATKKSCMVSTFKQGRQIEVADMRLGVSFSLTVKTIEALDYVTRRSKQFKCTLTY